MVEVGGREMMGRSSREGTLLYVFRAIDSHANGIDGDNGIKSRSYDTDGTGGKRTMAQNKLDRDWCRFGHATRAERDASWVTCSARLYKCQIGDVGSLLSVRTITQYSGPGLTQGVHLP